MMTPGTVTSIRGSVIQRRARERCQQPHHERADKCRQRQGQPGVAQRQPQGVAYEREQADVEHRAA